MQTTSSHYLNRTGGMGTGVSRTGSDSAMRVTIARPPPSAAMWREVWILFLVCMGLGFGALFMLRYMARQVNEDRKRGSM